ncbi:helix-turn-helix domain-containing protein [Polaribacter cellanae]|uniref:Helix-turn-helix domain-containing protein n=1 Tax=Polaribacter cellanae TaxID=2818493 RepID=A0A975CR37_9FLAO|nr:XRE family transcriptional regulator [Polaribacter cellanae]QTE23692.1 helix-turn-helix domain-containing protein [Polaribacter cellanae]
MEDVLINLGKELKRIRLSKGLNLKEVAKMSDVSIGLISKIENFRTTPSLPVLLKIMQSLDINLSELNLSTSKVDKYILIKKGEGEIEERDDSKGLEYTFLFSHAIPTSNLRTYIIKIKEGIYRKPVAGDTYEIAYVLQGKLDYILDKEIITLNEGDILFYDGIFPLGWNTKYATNATLLKMYLIKKQ